MMIKARVLLKYTKAVECQCICWHLAMIIMALCQWMLLYDTSRDVNIKYILIQGGVVKIYFPPQALTVAVNKKFMFRFRSTIVGQYVVLLKTIAEWNGCEVDDRSDSMWETYFTNVIDTTWAFRHRLHKLYTHSVKLLPILVAESPFFHKSDRVDRQRQTILQAL